MASFREDGVQVYFVYKKEPLESFVPDVMNCAFKYLQNYIEIKQITWLNERNVLNLIEKGSLDRKDIFVLEEFEGEVFEKLQLTKALIIGPRCLLSCILDDSPVPLGTSPIFITSMRDISVCISGLKESEKQNFRNLISYMGGCYIRDLRRRENLYLVSNTIKSTKYEQATLNSIPVMLPEWINAVWEKGKIETISASDPVFDKYKLPIFYAVNITTSGLAGEIREKIMKLVSDNGGNFLRTFKSNQTDILITVRDCADSEKFKAALKFKKDVLIPDWIFDSVTKGYALPITNYRVNSLKVSTPTKTDNSIPDFTGNFTQLSEISQINTHEKLFDDISICSNISSANKSVSNRRVTKLASEKKICTNGKMYKTLLAEINTQQAKKAGNFLDGCSIFLSGFSEEEKDKLNKILGVSGAHHYLEINEKITHIIVGEIIEKDFNNLYNSGIGASIVTLNWIIDSIKNKQPILNDIQYRPKLPIQAEPEAPSPRSKKSLQSLNHSFKKPEMPKKNLFATTSKNQSPIIDDAEVNGLLSHYSQDNDVSSDNVSIAGVPVAPRKLNNSQMKNPLNESNKEFADKKNDVVKVNNIQTMDSIPARNVEPINSYQDPNSEDLSNINFFDGLAIFVDKDYDHELYSQIVYDCEQALGKLVSDNYRDQVDYAIVSYEKAVDVSKLPVKSKYIVNGLWMDDAITANALVPIEYFHLPIPLSANKHPLTEMIIVVSVYSASERCFLEQLIMVLGATYKDTYMKKDKALLVVPSPGGLKYNAAIKWGYPAVTSSWLIKCSETGTKIDMTPYLVGETKVGDNSVFSKDKSSILSDPVTDFNVLTENTPISTKSKKAKLVTENNLQDANVNINVDTDITPLRHRRIFELAGCSRSTPIDSKNVMVNNSSPKTPSSPNDPYDIFEDLDEYLKNIPNEEERECCRQILLDVKNTETPELERLKKLVKTPGDINSPASPVTIPDFCRTPEFRKRMCEFIQNRWHLSVKKRRPDTPLSEIKMRLWRETLPAEFLSHLEGFGNNPQSIDLNQSNEHVTSKEYPNTPKRNIDGGNTKISDSSNDKSYDGQNEASPGVKRLKDFIKNCEEERNNSARKSNSKLLPMKNQITEEESQAVGVPQRYESEMMFNSERMVGWGDNVNFTLGKKTHSDKMYFKGIPVFNISTTAEFDKKPILQGIKKLRGEICENTITYDPKSTHIVCERPNRGEKLLSSVAAGKWILSINYVTESIKQGYFLNEELYEWGNPKAINLPTLKQTEQAIANAFYFWRNKISNDSIIKGAFSGFRVILHLTEKSQNSFANVITAGDGIVLKSSPPYEKSIINQATHCLVDPKKSPLDKKDYEKFKNANVPVISFMFISSYLTNDPNVDISEFILSL